MDEPMSFYMQDPDELYVPGGTEDKLDQELEEGGGVTVVEFRDVTAEDARKLRAALRRDSAKLVTAEEYFEENGAVSPERTTNDMLKAYLAEDAARKPEGPPPGVPEGTIQGSQEDLIQEARTQAEILRTEMKKAEEIYRKAGESYLESWQRLRRLTSARESP